MRRAYPLLALAACVAICCVQASPADAQVSRYSSAVNNLSRPALSPYLDYFRNDTGALPNYHQFVRPKNRLRADLLQSNRSITGLQGAVRRNAQRIEAGTVRPTGRGGSYMNFLHFYPQQR